MAVAMLLNIRNSKTKVGKDVDSSVKNNYKYMILIMWKNSILVMVIKMNIEFLK